MDIRLHMLIEWQAPPDKNTQDKEAVSVERILAFDITTDEVIVINIFDKGAFPILRSYQQILQAYKTKALSILEKDPFASISLPEDKIKPKHKEYRDAAWKDMAPLLKHENVEFLLYPWKRGPLIRAHSQNTFRKNKCGKQVRLSITTINKRLGCGCNREERRTPFCPASVSAALLGSLV